MTRVALRGIAVGPAEDWEFWSEHVGSEANENDLPNAALIRVLQDLRAVPALHEAAEATAKDIVPLLGEPSEEMANQIATSLDQTWWESEEAAAARIVLNRIAEQLVWSPSLEQRIREIRTGDIIDGIDGASVGPERRIVLQSIPHLLGGLDDASLDAVAERLKGLSTLAPESDEEIADEGLTLSARLSTASRRGLTAAQAAKPPYEIGVGLIARPQVLRSREGFAALTLWLGLVPTADAVARVIRPIVNRLPRAVGNALSIWAKRVGTAKRTSLAKQITSWSSPAPRALRTLAREGIDEGDVFNELLSRLKREASGKRRTQIVRSIIALRPLTATGVGLAFDAAEWLLQTGKQVDFRLAQRLTSILPAGHERAVVLADRFQRVRDENKGWPMTTHAERFAFAAASGA
jgi:hypothetical protein